MRRSLAGMVLLAGLESLQNNAELDEEWEEAVEIISKWVSQSFSSTEKGREARGIKWKELGRVDMSFIPSEFTALTRALTTAKVWYEQHEGYAKECAETNELLMKAYEAGGLV